MTLLQLDLRRDWHFCQLKTFILVLIPTALLLLFSPLSVTAEDFNNCDVDRLTTNFIVRNQGETSTCWLHSALQMMEQSAQQPLSIDALLIAEIKSRAMARFLGYETPWDGGAGPTRPFALALEHGLLPEVAWVSKTHLVTVYEEVFEKIEKLLAQHPNPDKENATQFAKKRFLKAVDNLLRDYTGTLPPKKFRILSPAGNPTYITAIDYAKQVIGQGDSRGYDFRNVKYSEKLFGKMPEMAWTTILSRQGELKKITDIIEKRVDRVSPEEAFQKAVEIFEAKRPVAFTFIWFDQDGEKVLGLDPKTYQYTVQLPAVQSEYTGSHLVLIAGVIRKNGQVIGFEVLDPLPSAANKNRGIRIVTKEFFMTHGKTVHEIAPPATCATLLK